MKAKLMLELGIALAVLVLVVNPVAGIAIAVVVAGSMIAGGKR